MAKKAKEPKRALAVGQTALSVVDTVESVPFSDGFSVSVNGLITTGVASDRDRAFAQSGACGNKLRITERGGPFAVGDFINYIEDRFGEDASQIIDYENGWSEKTCGVYSWVAKCVAVDRRRMDRLGIRHHLLVAPLSEAKQRHWLTKAAADDEADPWTVARLKAAIEAGKDKPPTGFYVLVSCTSRKDQEKLMAELEAKGRTVKAVDRRKPKKKDEQEVA